MKKLISSSTQPLLTLAVPTSPASPASGDAVLLHGNIPAVVSAIDTDDSVATSRIGPCIAALVVNPVNDFGNSAVSAGDKLYLTAADTVKLSKKASGIFFGYAYADSATGMTRTGQLLAAGATAAAIQVLVAAAGGSVADVQSQIHIVTVAVSNAELKALRAAPKTLVAAAGAGKVLEFLGAFLKNSGGTNAITESADNMAIKYTDGSGVAVSQAIEATGFVDQTAATITNALPSIDAIATPAQCTNVPLVLHNTGDGEYAGNAAADVTLSVTVMYRVRTIS